MIEPSVIEHLRRFDTCTIANAIERAKVRLRNEGYTAPGLIPVSMSGARIAGYAVTSRIRTADPPVVGGAYWDRSDWWDLIARTTAPRIAVVEDIDEIPGKASVTGAVHAAILQALGCVGLITNGAVRDIPTIREMNFPAFAGSIAVSHSYSHMVDFGSPVHVFGLKVSPGDLLLADCHGAINIPVEIAPDLPRLADEILRSDRKIIDFCRSEQFTMEKLRNLIRGQEQPA